MELPPKLSVLRLIIVLFRSVTFMIFVRAIDSLPAPNVSLFVVGLDSKRLLNQ